MQVITAYVFVIIIWATTPLAIQWSNSSFSFMFGVSLRMLVALFVFSVIMIAMRRPLIKTKSDWKVFFAGALGLYPNMILVYWSAQFIPSGLMAVILGIYPFAVGIFSLFFLRENLFSAGRVLALAFAVFGLVLIHFEQLRFNDNAIYGVLGMTLSAFLFGLSSVWLKTVGSEMDPLRQSTGVLVLAVPAFLITWFLSDGELPETFDTQSLLGVGYLSIAGSVIGHTLFFYVLKQCSMFVVSLITLITPVMALSIGYVFANESLTPLTILGTAFVIGSLLIYQRIWVKILAGLVNLVKAQVDKVRVIARYRKLRTLRLQRLRSRVFVFFERLS